MNDTVPYQTLGHVPYNPNACKDPAWDKAVDNAIIRTLNLADMKMVVENTYGLGSGFVKASRPFS